MLETRRLALRRLSSADAAFILELLNEPAFVRYIGDKGVRTTADARHYIADGPVQSYEQFGFGLYCVELKESGTPVGICGLLKREYLEHADLGFAFLSRYHSRGYAFESASAVLDYGRTVCGLDRIVAITSPDNAESIALLTRLGFSFERTVRVSANEPQVRLFVSEIPVPHFSRATT